MKQRVSSARIEIVNKTDRIRNSQECFRHSKLCIVLSDLRKQRNVMKKARTASWIEIMRITTTFEKTLIFLH